MTRYSDYRRQSLFHAKPLISQELSKTHKYVPGSSCPSPKITCFQNQRFSFFHPSHLSKTKKMLSVYNLSIVLIVLVAVTTKQLFEFTFSMFSLLSFLLSLSYLLFFSVLIISVSQWEGLHFYSHKSNILFQQHSSWYH